MLTAVPVATPVVDVPVATDVDTLVAEATLVEVLVEVRVLVPGITDRVGVVVLVGGTTVGVGPHTTPFVNISILSVGAVGAYPPAR